MTYSLGLFASAKKEWDALDATLQQQFKNKLKERCKSPRNEKDRLNGMTNCYKIKLRGAGYRLVYQVDGKQIKVVVVAIGKRERNQVYKEASKRL